MIDLNAAHLEHVDIVLWLNGSPHTELQRTAFEQYMEHGGGWPGFHAAAYNDSDTRWQWLVQFLGGAVFYGNSWLPSPRASKCVTVLLTLDASNYPFKDTLTTGDVPVM